MSKIEYYKSDERVHVVVPNSELENFKQLVRRAISTWQGCPIEIRDFADRLFEREYIMGDNMKTELGITYLPITDEQRQRFRKQKEIESQTKNPSSPVSVTLNKNYS